METIGQDQIKTWMNTKTKPPEVLNKKSFTYGLSENSSLSPLEWFIQSTLSFSLEELKAFAKIGYDFNRATHIHTGLLFLGEFEALEWLMQNCPPIKKTVETYIADDKNVISLITRYSHLPSLAAKWAKLLSLGANPAIKDNSNNNIFHHLNHCLEVDPKGMDLIKNKYLKLDCSFLADENDLGYTALDYAICTNQIIVLSVLLDLKAPISLISVHYLLCTPVDYRSQFQIFKKKILCLR